MAKQPNISRRRFLQTAGTTALAAPFLLPTHAWSAQNKALPNDRITLGFIGMGKQAGYLLNTFLHKPETQVVAVCEVDTTRREHGKKRVEDYYAKENRRPEYKGCTAYNDFRDLLARSDLDGVVISTPDHWHAIHVIQAANAGLDIYCEKPLSLTIREAKEMVKAVRQNQVVFQTGSQQRSSDNFRLACELVRNRRIGQVQKVEVAVGGPSRWCDLDEFEAPEGLDWNSWLGPSPMRGWNEILSPKGVHDHYPRWRNYREYSGGGMTDWGAHHFDIAQWGLGMDGSGPVKILPPDDPEADHGVKYVYANGVEMHHINGNGVTFYGTDGKIFVNRGKFEATPKEIAEEPIGDNEVHLYKSQDHKGDWLNCIRSRNKPICDVAVGASSVIVCHLGNLAYWYHRPLEWNPEKQRFVNDAEANMRWMDVNRRGPWRL